MTKKNEIVKAEETKAISTQMSNEEMFKMYRDVVAPGANLTATQFGWYVHYCQQRGFDPLGKDIFLVPRSMKQQDGTWKTILTPQSSIDAFRKRATASNAYEGQEGPYWCGADGKWADIWLQKNPPAAAKVGVMRSGFRQPVWGIALWSEYVQRGKDGQPTKFWTNMPANQLAKCAESLALRKAFPDQFGGIYTSEEMAQAANDPFVTEAGVKELAEKNLLPSKEKVLDAEYSSVVRGEPVEASEEPVDEDEGFPEPPPEVLEQENNSLLSPPPPAKNPPTPKNGKGMGPTKEELDAVRAAWKRTGIGKEKTEELLQTMTGGRKSAQWTREDFNRITEFLGDHFQAPPADVPL